MEMEKLTRTVTNEVDRYVARKQSIDNDYGEVLDILENAIDGKIFFNKSNTGEKDFSNSLLRAEEVQVVTIHCIEEVIKNNTLEGKEYGMISFYAENGYNGVSLVKGEECLTKRANNWINNGQDGLMFLLVGNDLEKAVPILQDYINNGIYEIIIFDNKEEDYVESFPAVTFEEEQTALKIIKEKYGITEIGEEY